MEHIILLIYKYKHVPVWVLPFIVALGVGAYHQGIKLKGYYSYFGVQPFTFPSKYFATLQKGRSNFL
jgi:hypothetical protein